MPKVLDVGLRGYIKMNKIDGRSKAARAAKMDSCNGFAEQLRIAFKKNEWSLSDKWGLV